jgi:DNA-binding GntR family transcriptional regulator
MVRRNNKVLTDDIVKYLRDSIISLRIKPGEQLNELDLIAKLKVSRSPLREAFRLLEGEGLIERKFRKGVFVREISTTDILELFPIRATLEALAAELAAPRLTEKEIQNLGKIIKKMGNASQTANIKESLKLNYDFHKQIVKGARNKKLEEIIKSLGRQSMWFIFATLYFRNVNNFALISHEEIYIALRERDGQKASKCMKEHVNHGAIKILEYLHLEGYGVASKTRAS